MKNDSKGWWRNSTFQQSFNDLNNWFNSKMDGKNKKAMDQNQHTRIKSDELPSTPSDIDFDLLQNIQTNQPYVEHQLHIEQLSDLHPLSRINNKSPELSSGLNQDEAQIALKENGPNVIKPKKRRKRDSLRLFFKQFLNKFRILLLIGGFACLIIYLLDQTRIKDLTMSFILFIVFFILSIVGYFEQSKILRQMNGKQKIVLGNQCCVIRGSKEIQIQTSNLVRGDLIWIRKNDRIPADCRLIYTKDFKIEASLISGEIDCINYSAETACKSLGVFEAQNLVFGGSSCITGEALGLIIRTGNNTLLGQLATTSNKEKHKSRLELEYILFSKYITLITLCIAAVIFIFGLILSGLNHFNNVLINGFLIVVIANIPQGLPVTLSAQLIIVAKKLAKMGIFIKRSDIADTLGLTSVLLIDKSTILASNKMQLTKIWHNKQLHSIDQHFLKENAESQTLNDILNPIFGLKCEKPAYQLPTQKTIDSVLMEFAHQRMGQSVDERNNKFELVFELPFTPSRRFHLAVVKQKSLDEIEDDIYLALIKGAPEDLIQNCSLIRTNDNTNEAINEELFEQFEQFYEQLSTNGNNCIGFASMQLDYFEDEYTNFESLLESKKWCFLGMCGISEPILADVEAAVKRADQARIRLFLLTNDHPTCAEALARQIGFYNQNSSVSTTSFSSMESINTSSTSYDTKSSNSLSMPIVLHGENLDLMTDQEWTNALKHRHIIFSRISPCQKMELIKHCRRMNYVVALTGNELMDAKVLKEADIGIVARTNCSIFAKDAADVVATRSDLPNIIESIAKTRLLFDNFRKTLAYGLSHLLPEIFPVLLSFILGLPLALNSLQVLTIDLMTEIPPSIALIFEPPERNIMKRPPRRSNARLVTPALLFYSYCIAGTLITIGCLLSYFAVFWFHDLASSDLLHTSNKHWTRNSSDLIASKSGVHINDEKQTMIYEQACAAWHICLVFTQIFNLISCTTRRSSIVKHGIKNPALVIAIIIKLIIVLLIMFVPPIQWIVGVKPPPFFIWLIPVVIGLILLLVNEARKFLIRRRPQNLIVRALLKW